MGSSSVAVRSVSVFNVGVSDECQIVECNIEECVTDSIESHKIRRPIRQHGLYIFQY